MRSTAGGAGASWVPLALVLSLTGIIYFRGLGQTPIYLGGDEAYFATHAHSIATGGRDLNGRSWPLFFNIADPLAPGSSTAIWYQPMLFYLLALAFKFLPVAEWAVRVPSAAIGMTNAFLMYAVARRFWQRSSYAVLASSMLVLSPAHFIFSRQALDYICPLPFVLGWLLCLLTFIGTARVRWLFGGGVLLGLGFYSYVASWVMMPLYVAWTFLVLWKSRTNFSRGCAAISLGFALPLLPLVYWLWANPHMLPELWFRYGAGHVSPPHAGSVSWLHGFVERISVYWDYFNPSYLFFSGGSNPTQSTRTAGVFLLPMSVFLACGAFDLARRHGAAATDVLLLGFAAAPLAVVATLPESSRYSIARELSIVPFGVFISVFGVAWLLCQRARTVRIATVLLLITMPIQFGYFLKDYFTTYNFGSARRFDPGNFRDVAEYVIATDAASRVPAVYLSERLDDGGVRWKFYLLKHHREDLWQRTRSLTAAGLDLNAAPRDSLVVLDANEARTADLLRSGNCVVAKEVADVSGSASAVILRKGS